MGLGVGLGVGCGGHRSRSQSWSWYGHVSGCCSWGQVWFSLHVGFAVGLVVLYIMESVLVSVGESELESIWAWVHVALGIGLGLRFCVSFVIGFSSGSWFRGQLVHGSVPKSIWMWVWVLVSASVWL